MQALLDTQVFYILATEGLSALPRSVREFLSSAEYQGILSSTSLIEIAIKHVIGKIQMDEEHTRQGVRDLRLTVLPFDSRHAFQMFSLPLHHRDPFDRMILATALAENLPVISSDRIFRRYRGIKLIW